MDNYLILGIIFILILGMLQLISINIRLRLDVKNANIEIDVLQNDIIEYNKDYVNLCDKYNTLKAKYEEFLRSTID